MTTFEQMLTSQGVERTVEEARSVYLLTKVAKETSAGYATANEHGLLASAVESLALATPEESVREGLFQRAFILRRDAELTSDLDGLLAAAALAADGVLASRSAEVLMLLRNYSIPDFEALVAKNATFSERLLVRTIRAFVLLVRRSNGWADLRSAAEEIVKLRDEHMQASASAVAAEAATATSDVVRLISGFNLAKVVDLAATFTASGQPANVQVQFDRHAGNRDELSKYGPDAIFGILGDLIQAASGHMIRTSIWTGTSRLGKSLRDFVSSLASPDRSDPLLELWPSQRKAIDSHLLDPARRAVVVEMPTSAGKTLIAEFSVIQAHALNPESTAIYVVPTRALVNQITQRLRKDFGPLNLVVESAIPVFELDPTEDALLLQSDVQILVCTPEKLDLLIKSGHPTVAQVSLVVIDEAHNIADGLRGARLELLLGMLKRERPEVRFLLLTPFVPNATQLASWLGDGAESTIAVNWQPSERVAVTAHWVKPRRQPYRLTLTTVASAGNVDVESGLTVSVGRESEVKVTSKAATTVELARSLSVRGGVLVLARGKGTSEARAGEIAVTRSDIEQRPPLLQAAIRFAEDEVGVDGLLPGLLSRGVAYHHAGVSHDLRYIIEQLIDDGHVDVVVGTTTLSQGMNFPISSVIVETLSKTQGFGRPWKALTYSEFWNIAGRAGRAMRDPLGLVAFPSVNKSDRTDVAEFLRGEATAVSSALLEAAATIGDTAAEFNLAFTRQNPDLAVLLQYLTHVTRLSGAEQTAIELEDILRSSLVYHQARDQSAELSRSLVSIARRYVTSLEGDDRGFLALVDGTGFSLASARLVFGQSANEYPEFRTPDFWTPDNLFDRESDALTNVVELLSGVPELALGLTDTSATFDAATVAGITRDWVSGSDIGEIADRWFDSGESDHAERLRNASSYIYGKLVGQIPWGIGAMQKILLPELTPDSAAGHIPSFVFYGVSSWEAVLMRMGGVPRSLAQSIGDLWGTDRGAPESFSQLREWISQLSPDEWRASADHAAQLSGDEAALIWRTLAGIAESES
ncbi:hypothetical protein DDT46_22510 [Mycobacteroides abscessus]|uniref:DEAD/DEAH box helicase n=1 Tax=Mycobacteroides abscessus TaxID=36809 RepID=A0ABD7HHD1_9MYCO|nr:DEAD/DEAH box helicase [Mycobacteroides abscessus]AWG66286.1 hypothetical protein DDT46_22510 [Mycobacteroides abscessus]RIT29518.1 hypothetical protein D2E76_25055 [Mycobacteroides abscessus]